MWRDVEHIGIQLSMCLAWAVCVSVEAGEKVAPDHLQAKGWNLVCLDLPGGTEIEDFGLSYSSDGEQFKSLMAGLPRSGDLFRTIQSKREKTTLLVSLVGRFEMGSAEMLFSEPGTYYLRWNLHFRNGKPAHEEIEQVIQVAEAHSSDVAFLSRLNDPILIKQLAGEDFFDRQAPDIREKMLAPSGADFRALGIVGELLKATRAQEPGDLVRERKTIDNALRWANAMWALAEEFPDSSYAPYAAYYAGCAYSVSVGETSRQAKKDHNFKDHSMTNADTQLLTSAARANPHYEAARRALSFAVERADAYLWPRAVYQQGMLHGFAAEWSQAEALMKEAQHAGDKIVDKWAAANLGNIQKHKP